MQSVLFSAEPSVVLRNHFKNPTLDAISAARTCYSSHIVLPEEISERQRVEVGRTTYEGGHHTVYQHQMFEFELDNVSRAFVHDFLHSHPFYNSSQQSQRYVRLDKPRVTIPPIEDTRNRRLFEETAALSWEKYNEITRILIDDMSQTRKLPAMTATGRKKIEREILEKAMEAARYDLCIAAHTTLIHTIDGVTLWRLYRLRNLSWEANIVFTKMAEQVRRVDPSFFENVDRERPLAMEETLEYRARRALGNSEDVARFKREFDADLNGFRSKLIGWTSHAEDIVGEAVRQVLGIPKDRMSDDDAIDYALSPAKNPYMLETLNLSVISPLMKTLNHAQYTFRKKLSHTADSQDQRHRTIPGSRPLTSFLDTREADYITPELIERNPVAAKIHHDWMKEIWERKNQLLDDGIPVEYASYLLPNSVAVRFVETGSLLNLFPKFVNRSCLRAEEEIWQVTMEEIRQVQQVHPRFGKYLGPPCFVRKNVTNEFLAEEIGKVKYCNQGKLYCRQPVWNFYPNVTIENILKV